MARKKYNGEGSIYQRQSDMRWVGSIVLGRNQKGRLIRKVFYGRSGIEVSEKIKDFYKKNPIIDTYIDAKRITLEEWMTNWFDSTVAHRVKKSTLESYKIMHLLHLYPTLGKLKITAITPIQIKELLIEKADKGKSPRTREYIYTVLSQALKQAMMDGVIPKNPCQDVKKPRLERKKKINPPSPQIIKKIINQVKGTQFEPFFWLAWETGMRRGEIAALEWSDIDIRHNSISVTKAAYLSNKEILIGAVKTESSNRTILVSKDTLTNLRQLTKTKKGLIFCNADSTPLKLNAITRAFSNAANSIGQPGIGIHSLRHAHAHALLKKKVPIEVVQNCLGHSSIEMTIGIYGHITAEFQKEIPTILDEIRKNM